MHEGEVEADERQVRQLIAAQFPQWSGLALSRVASAGTDNAIYRLGAEMAVRLPRIDYAERQVEKEFEWLPRLAPLPLAIPSPLALGQAGAQFPWRWAVHGWIAGDVAAPERLRDIAETARSLGRFVRALQALEASGGPQAGEATRGRGLALAARDGRVRGSIEALAADYDVGVLHAAWDAALATPAFSGQGVWIHSDLHEGNLLQVDGRLSAVIDFGLLGVGDPAADLTPAWIFLPAEARGIFRDAIEPDQDAWARARGWALSIAIIALAYYRQTNPTLVRQSRRAIAAVLKDRD